jgi:hypothetical protein
MGQYGVPRKLTTKISRLYENNEICVVNNGLQSDWARIISGVKQGCGFSGFLFILVLDWWVMNNSVEGKKHWNTMEIYERARRS